MVEAGPFEGLEDAPSGDLDGRLGGVGAEEIGAVGIAGGVGALTVFLLQVDLFAVECRFVDWLQVHPQRWLPNLIHLQR